MLISRSVGFQHFVEIRMSPHKLGGLLRKPSALFGHSQFSGAILKCLHQSGYLSNYWMNFWNIFNDLSHPFIFFFLFFRVPLWDQSQLKIAQHLDGRSHSGPDLFVDSMCPNQLSYLIKLIIFKLIISVLGILSAVLLHNPRNKSATFTDMLDVIFFSKMQFR